MSAQPQTLDYRSLILPELTFTLCNPSITDVEFTYGGDTYVIPAEGTLDIRPTRHRITDRENLEFREVSAKEILEFAVGEDGRSGRVGVFGVRVLFGDVDTQAAIWAEAAEANRQKQYENDLLTKYAHHKAVKIATDAGSPPPAPDKRVREAMERLNRYEAENDAAAKFQCKSCAWPFVTAEQLSTHIEATPTCQGGQAPAPAASQSNEVAALTAQVATLTNLVTALVTAPKNKGGRPRKEPAA